MPQYHVGKLEFVPNVQWDDARKLRIAQRIAELTEQRDELLAVAKEVIEDLAIRAKIDGDDCLNISDGILQRLEEAIAKAEK